jgi:AcrR family transcriptional regulator
MNEALNTRDRILEAAIKVFSSRGFHDTRMDDIVEESKTSKGSIYFYFKSKQEIFLGLIDTFIGLLETRVVRIIDSPAKGSSQVSAINLEVVTLFEQYRNLAKIVLIQAVGLGEVFENRRRSMNDRFCALIQKRLDRAVEDGSLPPVNTAIIARLWVGAMNELIIHWIYNPDFDLESNIPDINQFFINSIKTQETNK